MRLIDVDKLIEYLTTRQADFIDDIGKGWNAGITAAINICDKFPTLRQDEWISCTETPPKDGIYTVCVEGIKNATKRQVTYAKYKNGRWTDLYDNWENKCWHVTHWMPLPQPPKVQNDTLGGTLADTLEGR